MLFCINASKKSFLCFGSIINFCILPFDFPTAYRYTFVHLLLNVFMVFMNTDAMACPSRPGIADPSPSPCLLPSCLLPGGGGGRGAYVHPTPLSFHLLLPRRRLFARGSYHTSGILRLQGRRPHRHRPYGRPHPLLPRLSRTRHQAHPRRRTHRPLRASSITRFTNPNGRIRRQSLVFAFR